jgi:hypothetical protein
MKGRRVYQDFHASLAHFDFGGGLAAGYLDHGALVSGGALTPALRCRSATRNLCGGAEGADFISAWSSAGRETRRPSAGAVAPPLGELLFPQELFFRRRSFEI